jgi:predicted dehydrogenase
MQENNLSKRLRIGLIGCGSVSNRYIPHLQTSSMLEIVSLCDIKPERAIEQNKLYNVGAATYKNIDEMLSGVPFDLIITTTDMQMHGELNKKALMASMYGAKNRWPILTKKERHCLN